MRTGHSFILLIVLTLLFVVALSEVKVRSSTDQRVYSSVLSQSIEVTGSGFTEGIEFTLKPSHLFNVDYKLTFVNDRKVVLSLLPGKKWIIPERAFATNLVVQSVRINDKDYVQGRDDGVIIARLVEDPKVEAKHTEIRESQTKLVEVWGSDFALRNSMKVTLLPSFPSAYFLRSDDSPSYNVFTIQLRPGESWVPKTMKLQDGAKIALQVYSIDTGAGEYVLPEPVTIATIIPDVEGYVCDDSCPFAFNYRCEDPTAKFYRFEEAKNHNCPPGTDCTDCGGIDKIVPVPVSTVSVGHCTNTCMFRKNGVCDDIRGTKKCDLGTDCDDCGPVTKDVLNQLAKESAGVPNLAAAKNVEVIAPVDHSDIRLMKKWIIGLVVVQVVWVLIVVVICCKSRKEKKIVFKTFSKAGKLGKLANV